MGRKRKVTFVRDADGAAKRVAGSKAFDTLLAIYGSGKRMSAQDLCVICHYLSQCGVQGGRWREFAKAPGECTGNYKKLVDNRLPLEGSLYYADMPVTVKRQVHVTRKRLPFREVFRTIAKEVAEDDEIKQALKEGRTDDSDSVMSLPGYLEHPLVKDAIANGREWPLPLALYMDGVRYAGQAAGRNDAQALITPPPLV